MYYLCSENKGADQLHSYCAAALCLCLHIMQIAGFLMKRLIYVKGLQGHCPGSLGTLSRESRDQKHCPGSPRGLSRESREFMDSMDI